MRCYFHLMGGDGPMLDRQGVEVSSVAEARDKAVQAIAELRAEYSEPLRDWNGWRLEVVDETGLLLCTIRLNPAN